MKQIIIAFSVLALLLSCINKDDISGSENNKDELTKDEFTITTGEALDVTDYSATLTGYANLPLEFGDAEVGIMYGNEQSFEDAKKVVATGLDNNNKFTVTTTSLEPSTTYYYKSYVQNGMAYKYGAVKSFTTKESTIPAEAVDLGIVMINDYLTTYKLYWAKSNLSTRGLCANPEDYGDYYAWGETEPKSNYSRDTYKFGTSSVGPYGDSSTESMVLYPEDDAAHAKLGGKWRMPTDAEWTALRLQCTWTWTTQNGVNGALVTASNGNSIFLPAAGQRMDTSLRNVGSHCSYWSSSLDGYYLDQVTIVFFYPGGKSRGHVLPWCGLSVRPVYPQDEE